MAERKTLKITVLVIVTAAVLAIVLYLNSLMPIITGYAAKHLCSDVFISGRNPDDPEALDLSFSFIKYNRYKVNYDEKSVTARFLWGKSKAIYRDGFGATLVRDTSEEDLRKVRFPRGTDPGYSRDTIKWPLGDMIPDTATGINMQKLREISKKVIEENAYNGNIFAFLVMHKGVPVLESYKPRFDKNTRFISWSMAKSFTNALIGIMVKKDMIDVSQPAGLKEWQNDERSKITLNDLLHMESGLEWNEDYGNRSDVTVMLHSKSDMGRYAFGKKLKYEPGTYWQYSSGTTNIVSDIIQRKFNSDSAYYAFARNELFNRIGMPDAVFETDPSGTFVGSSYLFATARDYARFAYLFMHDGVFNGERILPEGWVKYSTTPASASKGQYGAFFWLNQGGKIPDAPRDMFRCDGHDGQFIAMFPSQDLAVIILGYSPSSKGGVNLGGLLLDVLSAVK